jgi:hypothetical protein
VPFEDISTNLPSGLKVIVIVPCGLWNTVLTGLGRMLSVSGLRSAFLIMPLLLAQPTTNSTPATARLIFLMFTNELLSSYVIE